MSRISVKNQGLTAASAGDLGLSDDLRARVSAEIEAQKRRKKLAQGGKTVPGQPPSQTNPFGPNPVPMSAAAQSLLGRMA